MIEPIVFRVNIATNNTTTDDYFSQMKNNKSQVAVDANNTSQHFQNKAETEENNNNKDTKASEEKKNAKAENVNDLLSEISGVNQVYFQFEYSEENPTEMILKVIDKNTDEVINQYPSDVSLKIMKMVEKIVGRGQLSDVSI